MREIWSLLLPATSDIGLRREAGLVIAVCLFLMAMLVALIVFWRLTRDLENNTMWGFGCLSAILVSLVVLTHGGQARLAAWGLIGGMLALIAVIVYLYGTDGPVMAWFLAPILMAAGIAGFWGALAVATIASVTIWLSAVAQQFGWYTPPWSTLPFHRMYLTFNVPTITALYLLAAIMAGMTIAP
jgi:hypothetical protein